MEDIINGIKLDEGEELEWFGPVEESLVARVEEILDYRFPSDFRQFLLKYGGGGISDLWVSGVGEQDKDQQYGYIIADTNYYRITFGIPDHFIVIQRDQDDNEPYCINKKDGAIYCVGLHQRDNNKVADSFSRFITEFLFIRD